MSGVPDDQLREKVAEAIANRSVREWETVFMYAADRVLKVVREVSATPAPPEGLKVCHHTYEDFAKEAATPAPAEQAKTLDELAPAWERYAARGFNDEDVERFAIAAFESDGDVWEQETQRGRDEWMAIIEAGFAVLAAVGPKGDNR